ncbi:MAG: M23 family metallopeptidase, partial [Tepidiformaceae bacterium]
VNQGGALLVRATGGTSGAVTVLGRTVPMQAAGGELVALVGFGTQDPPGSTFVSIDILNAQGEWDYMARLITVVPTEWTVDYIILPPPQPPDPNAPPPPPPPPDEGPLLPGIYAGITGKKWDGDWGPPLDEMRITGTFGEQRSFNGGPVQGHHGGTDFGANFDTPIYSTNAGVVVMSGLYLVRGNLVVVDHGLGVFSLYGHMNQRAVEVGDVVAKGEVLGYVGSTGLSTGAHLHWEVSVFGILVDGLRWLDGSQGF